jgi:hypothetical protein
MPLWSRLCLKHPLLPVPLLALLLATQALLSPSTGWSQAQDASVSDGPLTAEELERRKLYQQGRAAIQQGDFEQALAKLRAAWEIRASFDVALLLAQAEYNVKLYPESAEHLAYYLRHVSAKESQKVLDQARAAFEDAKRHVAELRIDAPAGSEIRLNGRLLGTAPLEHAVFVSPGTHRAEAVKDGQRASEDMVAAAGKLHTLRLAFPPPEHAPARLPFDELAPLPAATTASPKPPAADREERSMIPAYLGAGAFVLSAGLGGAFLAAASGKQDTIDAFIARHGESGCRSGAASPADCQAQADAASAKDNYNTAAAISFSVATLTLVSTATYLLWPRPAVGGGASSVRVTAAPTLSGIHVAVRASY